MGDVNLKTTHGRMVAGRDCSCCCACSWRSSSAMLRSRPGRATITSRRLSLFQPLDHPRFTYSSHTFPMCESEKAKFLPHSPTF
jgi:hypothetical protein